MIQEVRGQTTVGLKSNELTGGDQYVAHLGFP
jgi:hypothetical protein